ncbi:MAG: hypothetical protein DI601_00215 [Azospirillum brasilense]|nr:MAG: hypothetical protein DI601_00215 [Azospirillum brasilense]
MADETPAPTDAACPPEDAAAAARAHTLALVQAGSDIAWVGPAISLIIVLLFAVVVLLVMLREVPQGSQAIANVLLGTLGTLTVSVVGYYHYSTAGSRRKDDRRAAEVALQSESKGGRPV